MNIVEKIKALENSLISFIERQKSNDRYIKVDIDTCEKAIKINTADISDNREGLTETFETSLVNTDDIATLREGLEEVYEMLLEREV